jgi:hypothetical protein
MRPGEVCAYVTWVTRMAWECVGLYNPGSYGRVQPRGCVGLHSLGNVWTPNRLRIPGDSLFSAGALTTCLGYSYAYLGAFTTHV